MYPLYPFSFSFNGQNCPDGKENNGVQFTFPNSTTRAPGKIHLNFHQHRQFNHKSLLVFSGFDEAFIPGVKCLCLRPVSFSL